MSPSLSRIVQVLAFFVWTPIFYFVFFATIERRFGLHGADSRHVTNFVYGAFFAFVWFLIWRRQVRWTPVRCRYTLVLLLVTAGIAAGIGVLINPLWVPWSNIVIAWFCWAVLWIGSTGFIWRATLWERLDRLSDEGGRALRCSKCGYNMTGLHEARCPECGAKYTLDQIVASVVGRDR